MEAVEEEKSVACAGNRSTSRSVAIIPPEISQLINSGIQLLSHKQYKEQNACFNVSCVSVSFHACVSSSQDRSLMRDSRRRFKNRCDYCMAK